MRQLFQMQGQETKLQNHKTTASQSLNQVTAMVPGQAKVLATDVLADLDNRKVQTINNQKRKSLGTKAAENKSVLYLIELPI